MKLYQRGLYSFYVLWCQLDCWMGV